MMKKFLYILLVILLLLSGCGKKEALVDFELSDVADMQVGYAVKSYAHDVEENQWEEIISYLEKADYLGEFEEDDKEVSDYVLDSKELQFVLVYFNNGNKTRSFDISVREDGSAYVFQYFDPVARYKIWKVDSKLAEIITGMYESY